MSKMTTPAPLRQTMLADSTRVKGKRSLAYYPEEHKAALKTHMDKERDWQRTLYSLHNLENTYEEDNRDFKKKGWVGPLMEQPPIPSPAKKQQIKDCKAWLLPDTYKKEMVKGGTNMLDLFETDEFDEALVAAAEAAEADYEADMEAELWRASEEAQAKHDERKIEKEINAAEKEYSDKIEAIERKKTTSAKVTSHIDLTHDNGSGVGLHL